MKSTPRYLFVYGVLRKGGNSPMAGELERSANYADPATLAGRLFRIDWYPALISDPNPEKNYPVRGDLYELPENQHEFLRAFDAYESYDPEDPGRSEYIREKCRVQSLNKGHPVEAWVYLYQSPLTEKPEVTDGDWLAELQRQAGKIQTKNRGW
ncbi:MAG: gamma-glutamylcyclotransferase [Opitutales bacterium]|nr:gamma-glutamylcyclotransferase [Opitutales bacterium]